MFLPHCRPGAMAARPCQGTCRHTRKGRLENPGKSGHFPVHRSGIMPLCGGIARTVSQSDVFRDFYG
jgi:hypothetical protein